VAESEAGDRDCGRGLVAAPGGKEIDIFTARDIMAFRKTGG